MRQWAAGRLYLINYRVPNWIKVEVLICNFVTTVVNKIMGLLTQSEEDDNEFIACKHSYGSNDTLGPSCQTWLWLAAPDPREDGAFDFPQVTEEGLCVELSCERGRRREDKVILAPGNDWSVLNSSEQSEELLEKLGDCCQSPYWAESSHRIRRLFVCWAHFVLILCTGSTPQREENIRVSFLFSIFFPNITDFFPPPLLLSFSSPQRMCSLFILFIYAYVYMCQCECWAYCNSCHPNKYKYTPSSLTHKLKYCTIQLYKLYSEVQLGFLLRCTWWNIIRFL